jgi:tRNA A-37 threonylcarbamoyl transferase component Bud32
LKDYDKGIRYDHRKINKKINIAFLLVDKELFEIDVKKGKIGDFIAGRLLTPFSSLVNPEYLLKMEQTFKKRVIKEEIESLIINYGELSRSIIIKPEYFALVRISKRARTFPPLRNYYSRIFDGKLDNTELNLIMKSFHSPVEDLVKKRLLKPHNGRFLIPYNFIDNIVSRRNEKKFVNLKELSQASLYSYLYRSKAGLVDLETISKELMYRMRSDFPKTVKKFEIEDPSNYLSLNLSDKEVSLDDRSSLLEVLKQISPRKEFEIAPLGGALSEVYIVSTKNEKLVAKKFTDWHTFKWFALNIVALGAKTFYLSGRTRLENELGINSYLSSKDINVPSIIHVSLPKRILIRKFIDGLQLSEIVKENINKENISENAKENFNKLGEIFAKTHMLGVEFGDSKPENFTIDHDNRIFAMDLEQSKKGGDFAWDIAEFLFYSGHYAIIPKEGLKQLTESFIEGYMGRGNVSHIQKAMSMSYIRPFSLWTTPQVISKIVEILHKSID